MSARALPVVARLSRNHLRLLELVASGSGELHTAQDERAAERLSPAFVTVRNRKADITDAGREALKLYRRWKPFTIFLPNHSRPM